MTQKPATRAFARALPLGAIALLALAPAALAQPAETAAKTLPEMLGPWFGLVAVVISVVTTVYAWLSSRSKINADHLKVHDDKLIDHSSRLQAIEGELKHLPAKDDVVQLKLAVAEINGSLAVSGKSLEGVERAIRRIEDFLLKEPKR